MLTPREAKNLAEKMRFWNPNETVPECVEKQAKKDSTYGTRKMRVEMSGNKSN